MSIFIAIILFCLGALLASFVGVITERAYTGQSWLRGRSRCNSCRRTLTPLDLLPIISWSVNGGRCRSCRSRITGMYALAELTLGILFVAAYMTIPSILALAVFLVLLLVLLFVVLYDLRHTIVPVAGSRALIACAIVFALLTNHPPLQLFYVGLTASIIALGFFLIYFLSKGRAMGLGDTPVSFALALMAGSTAIPGLLFSFWIGALIGIGVLVLRRGGPRMGIEVPFVPFMAAGFLLAFFTQWNPFLW